MNQLLLARETGSLSPQEFARLQASQLVHAIGFAPGLRFDGGEKEAVTIKRPGERNTDIGVHQGDDQGLRPTTWAHQSGVNTLALDIDGRILVSGGADSSTKLWDLEDSSNGGVYLYKPTAAVPRSVSCSFLKAQD